MGLDNPLHIAFLVVILLLVFGARRLPEIGRSLGSGMREFKDSISGESHQQALTPGPQQASEQVAQVAAVQPVVAAPPAPPAPPAAQPAPAPAAAQPAGEPAQPA